MLTSSLSDIEIVDVDIEKLSKIEKERYSKYLDSDSDTENANSNDFELIKCKKIQTNFDAFIEEPKVSQNKEHKISQNEDPLKIILDITKSLDKAHQSAFDAKQRIFDLECESIKIYYTKKKAELNEKEAILNKKEAELNEKELKLAEKETMLTQKELNIGKKELFNFNVVDTSHNFYSLPSISNKPEIRPMTPKNPKNPKKGKEILLAEWTKELKELTTMKIKEGDVAMLEFQKKRKEYLRQMINSNQ